MVHLFQSEIGLLFGVSLISLAGRCESSALREVVAASLMVKRVLTTLMIVGLLFGTLIAHVPLLDGLEVEIEFVSFDDCRFRLEFAFLNISRRRDLSFDYRRSVLAPVAPPRLVGVWSLITYLLDHRLLELALMLRQYRILFQMSADKVSARIDILNTIRCAQYSAVNNFLLIFNAFRNFLKRLPRGRITRDRWRRLFPLPFDRLRTAHHEVDVTTLPLLRFLSRPFGSAHPVVVRVLIIPVSMRIDEGFSVDRRHLLFLQIYDARGKLIITLRLLQHIGVHAHDLVQLVLNLRFIGGTGILSLDLLLEAGCRLLIDRHLLPDRSLPLWLGLKLNRWRILLSHVPMRVAALLGRFTLLFLALSWFLKDRKLPPLHLRRLINK